MCVFQILRDWGFSITLRLGFILGICFVVMLRVHVDVRFLFQGLFIELAMAGLIDVSIT
jgi:hypothetical protein